MLRCSFSVVVFLCLLFVASTVAVAPAQVYLVREGTTMPGWHLLRSGVTDLEFRWDSPALKAQVVAREGIRYAHLVMEDMGKPETWGGPEVPVARAFIRIPADGSVTVAVEFSGRRSHDLRAWGAERLAPVMRPVPKIPGASPDDGWVLDEASYATPTAPPGTARIAQLGRMRGMQLAMIELSPVCYDPTNATLETIESAVVRISFDASLEQPEDRLQHSVFAQHAAGLLLNPPPRETVALPAGYLAIVVDSLYDAVVPLAEWKTRKGYPTTLTRLSEIPGGATATTIKNYIQNAYGTWDPPPEFVLLVGDSNTIPAWNGTGNQNPPTDLNYSCVDGTDWVPDLYLGRFSLRTIADIQGLVEKTVDYEQTAWAVDSLWTGREYFISSDDWNYHGVTEGTHAYCMAKARAHGVVCDSLWGFYGTGTPIATAVATGRAMVTYSGHGVETGWQGPTFSRWNVDQLNNLDRYPIVLSFACLTGNFAWTSDQDCYMERWIRRPGKGAVVAYGSSVSSFWPNDDYLQRRMWDALFDDGYNWTGGFILEGKLRYKQGYGTNNATKGYFEQYNILGDPSLLMYTLAPSPLAASFPAEIPAGTPQSVPCTVTRGGSPCPDALVCLYKAGEVHAVAYTDGVGHATLPIPSATAGALNVTVTAYNGVAFMGAITIGGGDSEPPSAPASIALGTTGLLTWSPATDNVGVTGYRVYRSSAAYFAPTPSLLMATTPSTSFDVSGSLGDPLANYSFRVTAIDAAINESAPSPTVGEHDYQLVVPSGSPAATLPQPE
ncbi:hypothetical protein JXA88_14625 [Candidatus Fermentibacteria bacterium]|nr:hypothetical protein [Candidatus Fermentibacteria bacterium]